MDREHQSIQDGTGDERSEGPAGVEYHPPHETLQRRSEARIRRVSATTPRRDPPPPLRAIRLIGCRVDWLTLALKVALDDSLIAKLEKRLDDDEQTRASFELREWSFALERRKQGGFILKNEDVTVVLDGRATGGWTVVCEFSGGKMMRLAVGKVVAIALSIGRACGALCGRRVRRLDLSADFEGFSLSGLTLAHFVKSPRASFEPAKRAHVLKLEETPAGREHYRSALTGITLCPGNDLMACIYDKLEELVGQPEKLRAEMEGWLASGYDGVSPVARVEFRFRTEVLAELGVRDGTDAFQARLDELWAYCTEKWLRMVIPESADRAARRDLDPRWQVVRDVVFHHRARPAARFRWRAGAAAAQAYGATLSHVGREHRAPRLREVVTEEGEVLGEKEQVALLTDDECEALVYDRVARLFRAATETVTEDLLHRFGKRRGALFVLYREGYTKARFQSMPPEAAMAA